MSDENVGRDDDEIPFPTPDRVVLTIVEDGAFKRSLPTITAVYKNSPPPDLDTLGSATNASLDRDPDNDGLLVLNVFCKPAEDELDSFSKIRYLEMEGDKESLKNFLDNVSKIKQFTWVISHDTFQYRWLIDCESTEILESVYDSRYLH
jgi:hypothetical protein